MHTDTPPNNIRPPQKDLYRLIVSQIRKHNSCWVYPSPVCAQLPGVRVGLQPIIRDVLSSLLPIPVLKQKSSWVSSPRLGTQKAHLGRKLEEEERGARLKSA